MRSALVSLSSMLGRFFQSRYPAASYETSERTVKDAGGNRIDRTRGVKFSGLEPFKRAIFFRFKNRAVRHSLLRKSKAKSVLESFPCRFRPRPGKRRTIGYCVCDCDGEPCSLMFVATN
jgi:hypothetical protein